MNMNLLKFIAHLLSFLIFSVSCHNLLRNTVVSLTDIRYSHEA